MNALRVPIILLASRNQQLAYLIQRYADNCVCQLLRAETGESVTRTIAQNRPDVILLDVSQANPEGQLILRELKSRPGTRLIPVILCATSETDCMDCEAEGRLLQPVLFAEFTIAVEEAGIQIPKNAKEV